MDARNDLHIKWLKWMKFTFINKVNEFGYEKKPFYEFIKICAHQRLAISGISQAFKFVQARKEQRAIREQAIKAT